MKQIWRISEARRRRARKGIWSEANENKASKSGPDTSFVRWTVAEASWGSRDAHVQSTATQHPRPQAIEGPRRFAHAPSLLY